MKCSCFMRSGTTAWIYVYSRRRDTRRVVMDGNDTSSAAHIGGEANPPNELERGMFPRTLGTEERDASAVDGRRGFVRFSGDIGGGGDDGDE